MYEKQNRLPELVRQTGKINGKDRVYIEDYAYSYLHELKKQIKEEPLRAVMYGKAFREEEDNIYLIYGITPVEEEASSFFESYEMLGYVNLGNSESGRSGLDGCYVFYEANEAMQEYLLAQNRQNMPWEEQACLDEENKRREKTDKPSAFIKLIQKLLLSTLLFVVVAAASAINQYDSMCEFAVMVARATQEIR